MSSRFDIVIDAIDVANARDPTLEDGEHGSEPASLLYGRRLSSEVLRLYPGASEHLRIAARGQHIERWTLPRDHFPEGRAGYLDWRRAQSDRHADRVGELMAAAGYETGDGERVKALIRKEGIKRNPEAQMLEDAICFVFLRWHFAAFAAGRDPEQLMRIVTKTARKMSAEARARALAEFELPQEYAAAFSD